VEITNLGFFRKILPFLNYATWVNRAFEPEHENINLYTGKVKPYPSDNLFAYELSQYDSKNIKAEAFSNEQNTYIDGSLIDGAREKLNIASSVMLHIGGWYKPSNTSSEKLAGSYGCFGFIGSSQITVNEGDTQTKINSGQVGNNGTSNSEYNSFVQKVSDIREKYKGTSNYKVLITVEKRKYVEKLKTVQED